MLVLAVLIAGCDAPVRIGVKQARAAGVVVPAGMQRPIIPTAFVPPAPRPASRPAPPVMPAAFTTAGLLHVPSVPQPRQPTDVVGLLLQPDGPQSGARSITFGQVFRPGQLPAGSGLAARIDGREVAAQLDVKATNPDGSVRFGVVTLRAAAPAAVMLVRTGKSAVPDVDLAARAAHDDVSVDLVMHGASGDTPYHFDAATLLSSALAAGKASFWLRGPLVTEARVNVPVSGSFRLTFDVRAYADGAMLTDIAFDNDYAMQPVGGDVAYDVTISRNGKPVLQHAKLRQFQYQTWHREIWSDGDPDINVVHDIAAMERTGAIQTYDLTTGVAPQAIDDERKALATPGFFDILGNAEVQKYMPMVGGRDDIGPLTAGNAVWLMTQNPVAARFALAQADAAGSVPIHFFDPVAGTYVTLEKYPKLWIDDRGGSGPDTTGLTQKIGNTGWFYDNAHQPELTYLPYLMTGSHYRLDQFEAQATATVLNVWPAPREDAKGIVVNRMTQVRAAGWNLREVVEAAFALPDASPLRRYFQRLLANNIDYLHTDMVNAHEGEATGWLPLRTDVFFKLAPWQEDFLASSLILAARQDVPGAKELLIWMTNFLAGRFLAEDKGFPPYAGGAFELVMNDGDGHTLQTWKEIFELSEQRLARDFADNGHAWSGMTYALQLLADRAMLGGLIGATHSDEARRAFDWLVAHAPQIGKQRLVLDPSWNIVPLSMQAAEER